MKSLPLFHKLAGTKVVVVGEGEEAEAKARLITRAGGIVCSEAEAHQAKIAFVALEDEQLARRAADRLKGMGLLVNVVDRPALCEFTTPSICDRDPVLIAIGTGGASAGLAKHTRLRIEKWLPQSLGKLALKLNASRDEMRERYPDGGERRRALDAALSEGGMLDPADPLAHDRVDQWLRGASTEEQSATHTIELTSDDPEDLTLRQARWLGMADQVIHDAQVPESILIRARADAERILVHDEEGVSTHRTPKGITVILRRA
ncbi:siroheme synthase [Erythrobacter sp. W53]|uniref:precorrin-2 dehydrogenase/sirohydrochlorin ferrochelatase family protein n=1 Tax=Erythrobacter sp. W53 TaxID=3425947 RepID=UPI003D76A19B